MEKYEPVAVSDKIIDKFLQVLADDKEFEEAAVRLRKTVLEDGKINETLIINAMFGENDE